MIIFLVAFLCIVKLPMLLTTDIQPWDEGMYATRVLSIHTNGDFFDQSSHSIGRFYSGSHPPLLIWIGYASTVIFGVNSAALKIIPFIFSLLCVIIIILMGNKIFDPKTGLFAAMIFSSNIIFNVFSKRFQFDYPYTFFILLSFYSIILFNENKNYRYLLMSGISFGFCLMVKILVGFYIPLILFISYFFIKDKVNFKLKDLIYLTLIGVIIALPWHVFMFMKYGSEFTDFFFKFHIVDRALIGVEHNEKNSGALYHVNYLLTIIPYSIIIFFSMIYDLKSYFKLSPWKIFLWIWFVTGMIILALFKTKLEVYILLVLTPGCILMSEFIKEIDTKSLFARTLMIIGIFLNILWFATVSWRPEIKNILSHTEYFVLIPSAVLSIFLLYFISRELADKIKLSKFYYYFILLFFAGINVFYFIKVPFWENDFQITEIKKSIDESGKKKIVYVATNYRHNPQFSFFFNGLDIGWKNNEYELLFLDTKTGTDSVKQVLENLPKNNYEIIVEKEGINRAVYKESHLFIPSDFIMVKHSPGYELYKN
ncbi:MAG TPA: glycosyltransferase family 39 protein [Ignavibacteria bacterium]|nr:glycosyltransferase family 39 protein [Ignavibacteria bacterium]